MKRAKVGIVGAAGYTGGELIRILLHHPFVDLVFISSRSQAGKKVFEVHDDLIGQSGLVFTADYPENIELEILFLCLPHGHSKSFLEKAKLNSLVKIIDLSSDFRLKSEGNSYLYGLPELNSKQISAVQKIANPGCFATAIQLAILPLAAANLITNDIHVSAITGSTGAGATLSETTHFSWRNNNLSVYKPFTHQHLGEIEQSITQLQPSFQHSIHFIPYRGDFARGIIATCYTDFEGDLDTAKKLYDDFYQSAKFVHRSDNNIHLKQVVNTNYCLLYLEVINGKLMIISIIDNLLKGASGQAVQNMNLMMGWEESSGLHLKATYF
jgi:N-acetyl-gamma-glutamyl-phosphate reductase